MQVFLSHNMNEREQGLTRELRAALAARGIALYLAERVSGLGHQLSDKVREAILRSDCVLVLWTRDGQHSAWVNQELGFARASGELIVPIVEVGCAPKGFLEGLEYAPLDMEQIGDTIRQTVAYLDARRVEKEQQNAILGVIAILGAVVLLAHAEK
jgi:hypothetical protein